MELKDKSIIILIEQIFNDLEFWYPYYRLKEAGARVTVVGSGSADTYTGKSGTIAQADTSAGQRAYDEGHLPGAAYAHLDEHLSGPITPNTGRHPLHPRRCWLRIVTYRLVGQPGDAPPDIGHLAGR